MQVQKFLIVLFHLESFFHKIQHWNLSVARWSLRGIHIKITAPLAILCSVLIIDQRMIHIDNAFL